MKVSLFSDMTKKIIRRGNKKPFREDNFLSDEFASLIQWFAQTKVRKKNGKIPRNIH